MSIVSSELPNAIILFMPTPLEILIICKANNTERYGIVKMSVFGSFARGETIPKMMLVVITMKKLHCFVMIDTQTELEQYLNKSLGVVKRRDKECLLEKTHR